MPSQSRLLPPVLTSVPHGGRQRQRVDQPERTPCQHHQLASSARASVRACAGRCLSCRWARLRLVATAALRSGREGPPGVRVQRRSGSRSAPRRIVPVSRRYLSPPVAEPSSHASLHDPSPADRNAKASIARVGSRRQRRRHALRLAPARGRAARRPSAIARRGSRPFRSPSPSAGAGRRPMGATSALLQLRPPAPDLRSTATISRPPGRPPRRAASLPMTSAGSILRTATSRPPRNLSYAPRRRGRRPCAPNCLIRTCNPCGRGGRLAAALRHLVAVPVARVAGSRLAIR